MGEPQTGSALRNTLKSLCCAHGWSYAIFWRFDPRDSLLLTLEDAYYEGKLGDEIANMLPQVHFLGEGIVGQAAFTGKFRWMLSDAHTQEWNLTTQHHCEDDSELRQQFSSGIKTIAVISVKPWGVVQFGSTQKILERREFLEQTQRLLIGTENVGMLDTSANTVLPWDCENYDLNGLLASTSSENSYHWNLSFDYGGENSKELLRNAYTATSIDNPFPSCLSDQLTAATEAQVVLSERASFDIFLKPNSSMNDLTARNPFFGTWSGEVSSLASSRQQLVYEIRAPDVADMFSSEANATSLCRMNSLLGPRRTFEDKLVSSLDYEPSAECSNVTEANFPESLSEVHGMSKNLKQVEVSEDLSELWSVDDLCQWFAPAPEHSICGTISALDNSASQSIELNPTSVMVESCALRGIPAVHNSVTPTVNSEGLETSALVHSSENSFLDSMGLDFSWGNMIVPVLKAAPSTASSECIAQLNNGTPKGLFSEILNGVANSNSLNGSSFENQISMTKRRRTEYSPVGLWIDHSHSINGGTDVPTHHREPEEPTKATRKRARPGESTRPRPKDRQQIQDRIKELRGIIPNGGKCSIDSLLERTIKYMLFLQSITKYADKLQEPKIHKLIEQANGVVLKDKCVGDSEEGSGVTWAFEVEGQTMVCPIIVEDMSPPGQMLIEMLCEEQGFLLEIAEIIRGFGLNILKGKMEIRENKLWARFIVEANRNVTRIDVFWSLVRLLQETHSSGMDSGDKSSNVFDAGIPALDNYHIPLAMTDLLG